MKFLFYILLLFSLQPLMAQTVYTPNGTAVPVLTLTPLTPAEVAYFNSLTASVYPNAQKLAEPTSSYNCHAYAWYLSAAIGSTPYWMNTPGNDEYWMDGSYIEVCSPADGNKISYPNGDHSAIRSITAGKFDSKWGAAGLMRHDPADCPYISTGLKYYTRVKITASTPLICGGGAVYSTLAIPGASYTWTSSSNINLAPSTTNTVNASTGTSGAGWVKVTITSSCSPYNGVAQFNVDIPVISGTYSYNFTTNTLTNSNPVQPLYTVTAQASSGGASSYTWTKISGTPNSWSVMGGNGSTIQLALNPGLGAVTFQVKSNSSTCPSAGTAGRFVTFWNQSSMMAAENNNSPYQVWPNPANAYIEITPKEPVVKGSTSKQQQLLTYDVYVYDLFGTLVYSEKNRSQTKVLRLNTDQIKAGNYVLRIVNKESSASHHIRISH